MKKLFIALTAIIAMASCKKETVNPPAAAPVPVSGKTITVNSTSIFGTEVETTNFNTEGKVTKWQYQVQGTNTTKVRTFDYSTIGRIIVTEKEDSVLKYTYNCIVNLKGLVIETNIYKADGSLFENRKYSYDANDYLVKTVTTNNTGSIQTTEFEILNGNVSKRKAFNGNTLIMTTTFTFDFTRANKFEFATGGEWRGSAFGKSNANLITNIKAVHNLNILKNEDRVYVLNADGTVQKMTGFDAFNSQTLEEKYSYQ